MRRSILLLAMVGMLVAALAIPLSQEVRETLPKHSRSSCDQPALVSTMTRSCLTDLPNVEGRHSSELIPGGPAGPA